MNSECLNCGNEFIFSPARSRGKYCSLKCKGIHQSALKKAEWYAGINPHPERITLKRYLAEDRGYKCAIEGCGISEWMGKPLTLQLDHIDGNPGDDSPTNVRLICPSCHSQTEFLGNANKGRGRGSLGMKLN